MINYLSLFSGIGAFEKALKRLKVNFQLLGYSEIDEHASKAYSLIHGVPEWLNLGDITLIDERSLPLPIDLITYGFPCQPFSVAGKQEGFDDSKGRGNLFFDALKIIKHTTPKIAIAENVKNLTGKKFKNEFACVLQSLDDAGYNNYFQILNAKEYGVPQNRERVFIVSIRKDLDTGVFQFPDTFPLLKRLKDVLEPEVDEKYFISEDGLKYMNRQVKGGRTHWDFQHHNDSANDVANCLTANMRKGVPYNVLIQRTDRLIQVGQMYGTEKEPNPQAGRIYSAEGISPTMDSCSGGNRMPKILNGDIIRKLTPLECFRLMDFDDSDCRVLVDAKISNTQLYKMAGNSIVVGVAEEILCQIFDNNNEIWV